MLFKKKIKNQPRYPSNTEPIMTAPINNIGTSFNSVHDVPLIHFVQNADVLLVHAVPRQSFWFALHHVVFHP